MTIRNFKAWSWMACIPLAVILMMSLSSATARAEDDASGDTNATAEAEKPADNPAIEQAALAAQLAMEGQRRQSPILMLAAVELLGGLQASDRDTDDVTAETTGGEGDTEKESIDLDPQSLVDLAQEYAAADEEMAAFVAAQVEALSSRGLVWSQGADLPSETIAGTTFKIIDSGLINAGATLTLSNVIFEGGRPAIVAVIGDGDGDLDLWVYDGNNGVEIGEDTDLTSRCVVEWTTRYEGPFTIEVSNVGDVAEYYVVLCNW